MSAPLAKKPPHPRPDLRARVERMLSLRMLQSRTDAVCQEDWWSTPEITPIERWELRSLLRSLQMESEDTPEGTSGIRVDLGGWAWEVVPDRHLDTLRRVVRNDGPHSGSRPIA